MHRFYVWCSTFYAYSSIKNQNYYWVDICIYDSLGAGVAATTRWGPQGLKEMQEMLS